MDVFYFLTARGNLKERLKEEILDFQNQRSYLFSRKTHNMEEKRGFGYAPPDRRYTNTISKASLAMCGTCFALIVDIGGYEGEFYPETK